MEQNKQTVGSASYELQKKSLKPINAVDLQQTIHKGNSSKNSFETQINITINRGLKLFDKDFYVVVLFKKERLLQNVIRQMFFPRKSCPTPEYDQIVYHYTKDSHSLKFIWVIPDKETTLTLPLFQSTLTKEHSELLNFVKEFNNGNLDKLCEKLNLDQ